MQFFNDMVRPRQIHLEKLRRPPFFRLMDPQENRDGRAFRKNAFDCLYKLFQLPPIRSELWISRYVQHSHLLPRPDPFPESQIAERPSIVRGMIGFEPRFDPPRPDRG